MALHLSKRDLAVLERKLGISAKMVKVAGSLPDELRRRGIASATIANPQGETLTGESTASTSTLLPPQIKPRKRPERAEYLSLRAFPIGRTVVLREGDGKVWDVRIELGQ